MSVRTANVSVVYSEYRRRCITIRNDNVTAAISVVSQLTDECYNTTFVYVTFFYNKNIYMLT